MFNALRLGIVALAITLGMAASASAACNSPVPDGHGATWKPDSLGRTDVDVTEGIIAANDAYDVFGTLFVAGTAYDAGAGGVCVDTTDPLTGTVSRRYPDETINGLTVHRVLSFKAVPSGGAQIHVAVRTEVIRAGASGANTPVAVGEDSSDTVDDLGSDADTTVILSSPDWQVTADHATGNLGDPAIYHGWGAAYAGQQRPTQVGLAAATGSGADNWRTRWTSVALQPFEVATFTTIEAVVMPPDDSVASAQAALGGAASTLGAPSLAFAVPSAALEVSEIRASRNVAVPKPTGTLAGPTSGPPNTPETFAVTGVEGGAGVPACGAGSVAWSVDGAPVGSGPSISRSFAAGAHSVAATISGDCSSTPTVLTQAFNATSPAAPPGGGSITPAASLDFHQVRLTGGCAKAPNANATLGIAANTAATGRVKLTIDRLSDQAGPCVAATSKAGKKLLAKKAGKNLLTRRAAIKQGGVLFSIPLDLVTDGASHLSKGRLTLARGTYRVLLAAGKATSSSLLFVR